MLALNEILIILSVVFLVFVVFSIPFLLQILRTAKSMDLTLRTFNEHLPRIMKNLEEITTNISLTTTTVQEQVEELSLTMRRIQGTISVVAGVEEVLRRRANRGFVQTMKTSFAVAKGIRVFLDYLMGERAAQRHTADRGA